MKKLKLLLGACAIVLGLGTGVEAQTTLTNGLVAYYPFNGNANDLSGNGNDCSVNGATLATSRFGEPSASYLLTTYPQSLNTSSSVGFPSGTNDFSISLWVALNFLTNDHQIVFCNASVNDFQLDVWPSANGTTAPMDFITGGHYGSPDVHTADIPWVSAYWYHLQIVRSQNVVTIYRDGVIIGQSQTSNGVNAPSGSRYLQFGLGVPPQIHQLYGQLDDIRVYNRALSANEIQELFVYESQTHANGAFQLVYGRYSWTQAKTDAETRGGHLATFPNQAKWNSAQPLINQFNSQIVQDLWLGGYQPAGSPEPAGNWTWITGEPWTFSVWWPGEPNNQGGTEDSLMVGFGGLGWNDASSSTTMSYLLEYGPQLNLIKAVKPSFSLLAVGMNYQLQLSADFNTWTNQGSSFTATNSTMIYPQYWDVANWNNLFFRLQAAP